SVVLYQGDHVQLGSSCGTMPLSQSEDTHHVANPWNRRRHAGGSDRGDGRKRLGSAGRATGRATRRRTAGETAGESPVDARLHRLAGFAP
nr:hypothetical protein [Tanacetum cinerariifolium]